MKDLSITILHWFLIMAWGTNVIGAPTNIHDIQGPGSSSPLVGVTVTIEGVVVGDFQQSEQLKGFFVQEEDVNSDADPLTSEGIFVYDNGYGVDVGVGHQVRITGVVEEYYGLTQINSLTEVTVTGVITLPSAAALSLPFITTDEPERYEGMRVTFSQSLTVNDNYNLGRYGQVILSNQRHYQFTHQNVPDVAGYAASLNTLELDTIVLDDNTSSQNPDPIGWPGFSLSAANTLRAGDTITGFTGVVSYRYGENILHATESVDITHKNPRSVMPPNVGGSLKVASLNVLSYFSTIDTGSPICGPSANMDCRGADSTDEFSRQRDKVFSVLAGMDADIVGLIEIENHPTDTALANLVEGLNTHMGSSAYNYIATGPIGTDAIKVAIIYKTGTVNPTGGFKVLDSSVDPTFIDDKNRPSLAQTFEHLSSGESLTIAVNHFKSKGSDCESLGDPNTSDGQGNCNLTRTAAATALVNWLETDPTNSGDTDFLLIGDFNSYAKEDPIMVVTGSGYTDLLAAYHGQYPYSYIYYGESGYLDYALASASLVETASGAEVWHINADEPKVLDYNMEYKSANQKTNLYASDSFRASDHDPIIIGINLGTVPTHSGILYYIPPVMSGIVDKKN